MNRRAPFLLLLLAACAGGGGAVSSLDDMPDVRTELQRNPGCETVTDSDGNEQPVPGATTWWIGEFLFVGDDDVEGRESWYLLANDAWVGTGDGVDCEIVWSVAGRKTSPFTCTTCDYGLELEAFLERSESTCVARLVNEQPTSQSLRYDVLVSSDGTSRFTFDSGSPLGGGDAGKNWVNYVTDSACKWF